MSNARGDLLRGVSDGEMSPTAIDGYDAPTSYEGYQLVWSDEFDGGALDLDSWQHELGTGWKGWGNNELQYYRAKNTQVANGLLVIEAKAERFAGKKYTSSRIRTKGQRFFRYGRVDIRARLPSGRGLWPALWMLGETIDDVGWPACGEIDIMEMRGNDPSTVLGTAHWQGASGDISSTSCSSEDIDPAQSDSMSSLKVGTFADEFHVFSIIWNESQIQWYLDGATAPYHTVDVTPTPRSCFDGDFYFLFNVAVGGDFLPNPRSAAHFPQKMWVDYIRVYQCC
jgi:beta-glucanase (GH16 family)